MSHKLTKSKKIDAYGGEGYEYHYGGLDIFIPLSFLPEDIAAVLDDFAWCRSGGLGLICVHLIKIYAIV